MGISTERTAYPTPVACGGSFLLICFLVCEDASLQEQNPVLCGGGRELVAQARILVLQAADVGLQGTDVGLERRNGLLGRGGHWRACL